MRTTPTKHPEQSGSPMLHEADIGSGEKTPAQHETEEMIRQIPPLPSDKERDQAGPAGRTGQAPPKSPA